MPHSQQRGNHSSSSGSKLKPTSVMPSSVPHAKTVAASAAESSAELLGELALSSAPLTAQTSLLRLLAPDVQQYIMEHKQQTSPSNANASAAATQAPRSFGGGISSGEAQLRVATSLPLPGTVAIAGRRATGTSTMPSVSSSFYTQQPPPSQGQPAPRRMGRRSLNSGLGTLIVGNIDAAASVHAQLQADFAAATATAAVPPAAAANEATGGGEQGALDATAPPLLPSQQHSASVVGSNSSRTSRLREREREKSSVALLHRVSSGAAAEPSSTLLSSEDTDAFDVRAPLAGSRSARSSSGVNSARQSHKQLAYSLSSQAVVSPMLSHSSSSSVSNGHGGGSGHHSTAADSVLAPTRFLLPGPSVLSINDGYTGSVDRWPASASGGALDRKFSGGGGGGGGSGGGGPSSARGMSGVTASAGASLREVDTVNGSAPRFQSDLEYFVSSEMRAQHISDRDPPSLARLQIYREAFLRFLSDFTSYKPILSRVLREYEEFIRSQDSALAQLPLLQRQLATLQQVTDAQVEEERRAAKEREEVKERANQRLQQEILALRENLSSLHTKQVNTAAELAALQAAHAQLGQSHATLNAALSRSGAERLAAWEAQAAEAELNRSLSTKVADLTKQQENLLHNLSLLRRDAAAQALSCTPADLARLHEDNASLTESLKMAQEKYQARSSEYFALLTSYERATAERDELRNAARENEEMKRSHTPRPDWQRLLDKQYLPPSCSLSLQSSESLLDSVCSEVDRLRVALRDWELRFPTQNEVAQLDAQLAADGARLVAPTHLKSRGQGDDVPLYLRWGRVGQKIRNKNLSKRDTEIAIKEIWQMKLHTPEEQGGLLYKQMSLSDFMHVFLKKKFGFQDALATYAYALVDALERYRFDGDCSMFLQILNAQLPEAVYLDQHVQLQALRAAFVAADADLHKGRIKGRLPRKVLLDAIARFYSHKNDTSLRKLSRALYVTNRSETLEYASLFEEDREGNQGPFLEQIRDQHLNEISSFMKQLETAILDKGARYDGFLRLSQIREIITVADPLKPAKEVEAYLKAGCDIGQLPPTVLPASAPKEISIMSAAQAATATTTPQAAQATQAEEGTTSPSPQPPPLARQTTVSAAGSLLTLPDDTVPLHAELFWKNMSRLLIKRTGPEPPDPSEALRKTSVVKAASLAPAGSAGTASATGGAPSVLRMPSSSHAYSGMSTPDPSDGVGGGAGPSLVPSSTSAFSTPFATPNKSNNNQLNTNPSSGTGSPSQTAATTPGRRSTSPSSPSRLSSLSRPGFSQLARRISVGGANLAAVVMAAKQQQVQKEVLQQQQEMQKAQKEKAERESAAAAAAAAASTPSHHPISQARAAASNASLDRLTSFVREREERRREADAAEAAAAVAAASRSSFAGFSSGDDSLPAPGAGKKPRETVVLQLRREDSLSVSSPTGGAGGAAAGGDSRPSLSRHSSLFAPVDEDDDDDADGDALVSSIINGGSTGGGSRRDSGGANGKAASGVGPPTPMELESPRTRVRAVLRNSGTGLGPTSGHPSHVRRHSTARGGGSGTGLSVAFADTVAAAGIPSAAASPRRKETTSPMPLPSAAAAAATESSSLTHSRKASTGSVDAADVAAAASGGSNSAVAFSPPSSPSVIASRKSLRLSMRKSGGLALLLSLQSRADPGASDPDLQIHREDPLEASMARAEADTGTKHEAEDGGPKHMISVAAARTQGE